MNYNSLRITPVRSRSLSSPIFVEPKITEFNEYFCSKIRSELRLIKHGLEMHNYPIKKLAHREVWRIGKGDDLYLLSYYLDPFKWVLLPHSDNLASIIAHSLTAA